MGYQVTEATRRYRARRDEWIRTNVRWWRRKRWQRLAAMADRIYDTNRSEEAWYREHLREQRAQQASGEGGAE